MRSSGCAGGATSSRRAGSRPSSPIFGDWSAASGHRIGGELDIEPGTAIFAGNDHMAIGLLSALRERGLRVPEDVSVVGFDDVPEAAYLYPSLTTVRQDFAALGELIMQKVLVAVEEPDSVTEDTPLPDAPDRAAVHAFAGKLPVTLALRV